MSGLGGQVLISFFCADSIATELSDPFGDDDNDLPLAEILEGASTVLSVHVVDDLLSARDLRRLTRSLGSTGLKRTLNDIIPRTDPNSDRHEANEPPYAALELPRCESCLLILDRLEQDVMFPLSPKSPSGSTPGGSLPSPGLSGEFMPWGAGMAHDQMPLVGAGGAEVGDLFPHPKSRIRYPPVYPRRWGSIQNSGTT